MRPVFLRLFTLDTTISFCDRSVAVLSRTLASNHPSPNARETSYPNGLRTVRQDIRIRRAALAEINPFFI